MRGASLNHVESPSDVGSVHDNTSRIMAPDGHPSRRECARALGCQADLWPRRRSSARWVHDGEGLLVVGCELLAGREGHGVGGQLTATDADLAAV